MSDYGIGTNLVVLLGLAAVQLVLWWYANVFVSRQIGRTTKDDFQAALEGKWGCAVLRLGIHISITLLITSAFNRFV